MITLGLDPSLTGFGWCVHDSSKLGSERIVQAGVFSTSPKTMWVKRYVDLRENVAGVLDRFPTVEAVGVESPPFGELWSEGLYGLFLMVNEAVRCLEEQIVTDPADVDFAMIMGTGFAPFRGGPLRYTDTVGATRLVGAMNHLVLSGTAHFEPCNLLAQMAASGEKFYPKN